MFWPRKYKKSRVQFTEVESFSTEELVGKIYVSRTEDSVRHRGMGQNKITTLLGIHLTVKKHMNK